MKTLVYSTLLLLCLAFLTNPVSAKKSEVDKSKTYDQEYTVKPDAVVDLANKFGMIHVTSWDQDKVSIHVDVKVGAKNDETAQKYLDKVDVRMSGSADRVSVKTDLDFEKRSGKSQVTIDYTIKLPRSVKLIANNRFGDVVIDEMDGPVHADISYGGFQANVLKHAENTLKIRFGKAEIGTFVAGSVDIGYCETFRLKESARLEMEAEFSKAELGAVGELELESRYDHIKIQIVDGLDIDSRFSHVDIGVLGKWMTLDNQYGGFEIDRVAKDFKKLDIDNEFAAVELDFEAGAGMKLDADVKFADLKYPSSWNINHESSNSYTHSYEGTVGGGGGEVSIDSKYGAVKMGTN